jgi:hypothetical protein
MMMMMMMMTTTTTTTKTKTKTTTTVMVLGGIRFSQIYAEQNFHFMTLSLCIDTYLTKIRRRTLPQSSVWYEGSIHPTGNKYKQLYKASYSLYYLFSYVWNC